MRQIADKKNLLALFSGLLLTASFPPLNTDWLIWISIIPLMISIQGVTPERAFKLGLIAGLAHYITLIYWIVNVLSTYGGLNIVISIFVLLLLCLYLSLYTGIFSIAALILSKGRIRILLLAGIWVTLEYIRAHFLSGFPWGLLGHSLYSRLTLVQIADITGVYGISFIIVAVNLIIQELTIQLKDFVKNRYLIIESVLIIIVLITSMLYGKSSLLSYNTIQPENRAINISIIQGNIDQAIKWDESFQEKTLDKYISLSKSSFNTNPDIIVWPETAVPLFFQDKSRLTERLFDLAKEGNTHLLFGSPAYKRENRNILYYNSAWHISPAGELKGQYSKHHLVPFGEYVPFQEYLPFVHRLVPSAGDFSKGESIDPLLFDNISSGVLICYEIIFPDIARHQVRNGAVLLINITNDAWFGYSSAPYQHLFISVFRAIENRRPLIRSANTGISAIVDPTGRVMACGDIFTEEVITSRISTGFNNMTFYSRYGDIFALVISIICIITVSKKLLSGYKKNKIKDNPFHIICKEKKHGK